MVSCRYHAIMYNSNFTFGIDEKVSGKSERIQKRLFFFLLYSKNIYIMVPCQIIEWTLQLCRCEILISWPWFYDARLSMVIVTYNCMVSKCNINLVILKIWFMTNRDILSRLRRLQWKVVLCITWVTSARLSSLFIVCIVLLYYLRKT